MVRVRTSVSEGAGAIEVSAVSEGAPLLFDSASRRRHWIVGPTGDAERRGKTTPDTMVETKVSYPLEKFGTVIAITAVRCYKRSYRNIILIILMPAERKRRVDATQHPACEERRGRIDRDRRAPLARWEPGSGAVHGWPTIHREGQVIVMALYMDVHRHVDATLEEVQEAHALDLEVQEDHGVDYRKFWVDEEHGTIFCLFEAPSATAGETVHEEAHGLTADEIHEVVDGDAY